MKTLFLAWQDPVHRRWYPVGRVTSSDLSFAFSYTQGALQAQSEAGFHPLRAFPDLHAVYVSPSLFSFFRNRLMAKSRPEYQNYLAWLSIREGDIDPLLVLSRSGGSRVTDTIEMFPHPEPTSENNYEVHFLLRGLSHMTPEASKRAGRLESGERLLPMFDWQNPVDPEAIALRTSDFHLIGYCPRYLSSDMRQIWASGEALRLTVAKLNSPPAPIQFRVLCRISAPWPKEFRSLSGPEFQPLVRNADERIDRSTRPVAHIGS